jgi:hypothetical protein
MAVVPFSPAPAAAAPAAAPIRPPDSKFLMMAAAQMHKEGRLVPGSKPTEPQNGKGQK